MLKIKTVLILSVIFLNTIFSAGIASADINCKRINKSDVYREIYTDYLSQLKIENQILVARYDLLLSKRKNNQQLILISNAISENTDKQREIEKLIIHL